MKKILSLILAGLMTASCAAFVAADEADTADKAATLEDYAIEFLWNQKIFKGTGTAEELVADADAKIERYQMALFVSRMSTGWVDDDLWEDDVANDSTFKDIDSEPVNKYLGAISYANQNGIIEGYNADEFGPYDSITYRDALTMVVRTLGYKGLSYPWGYIEKAVELGLTDGIDVAYTTELTRGQVAIIIYHAMFAATKNGETLAKSMFDVDFAWENIVIVASDRASFESNGLKAATGYVAFKILQDNVDATLKSDVYYVKASELGLDGHTDDLAVGSTYVVLVKSVDSKNIVSLVNYYDLCINTIYNDGKYVNATAIDLPISVELGKYALVNKFQTADYISATDKPEMMLYVAQDFNVIGTSDALVGIDWATLNIVKRSSPTSSDWTPIWFYEPTLQQYFRYVYNDATQDVYVDWMSDAEFEASYAQYTKYVLSTEVEFVRNAGATTTAPYAELKLYDLDEDGLAERAMYKHYNIGYFYNTTAKCATCNADKAAYTIKTMNGAATIVDAVVSEDHAVHATVQGQAWLNVSEAAAATFTAANGSLVIYSYDKTTGELEILKHISGAKADETDDDYITTGILKGYSVERNQIVLNGEFLPLGYAELQAYGVDLYHGNWDNSGKVAAKVAAANALDAALLQYVTVAVVDGKVVDIDINNAKNNNVIICLGYAGVTADGYIAVYGYSTETISDEGYGVANKYDVDIFKIASYNGWKRGDYTYYPNNAFQDEAFEMGSIYKITSYDAETDTYNVYTENVDSAKASATPVYYGFEDGYRINLLNNTIDAQMSANDQYVIVLDNGAVFVYKGIVKADWWQVKGDMVKIGNNFVIYVDGPVVINEENELTNFVDSFVLGFHETAHEIGLVMYDNNVTGGANWEAWYDEALATSGDAFLEAGNYLLGSTQTKVRVFDLLTGTAEYAVVANNIDLVKGRIYITIGNTILGEMGVGSFYNDEINHVGHLTSTNGYYLDWFNHSCDFIDVAKQLYWDISDMNWYMDHNFSETLFTEWWRDNYQEAEYMVYDGEFVYSEDIDAAAWMPAIMEGNSLSDLQIATWLYLVDNDEAYNAGTSAKLADALINNKTYYMYDTTTNGCALIDPANLSATKTYLVALIYDVDTKNVVIYIYADMTTEIATTATNQNKTVDTWYYDADKATVESTLKLDVEADYTRRVWSNGNGNVSWDPWYSSDGNVDDAYTTVNSVRLWFDNLYAANKVHGEIAVGGYLFGIDDFHGISYFGYEDTQIEITKGGNVVEYDATELKYDVYPCDDCGIVYGISLENLGIVMGRSETVRVAFSIDGASIEDMLGGNDILVVVEITTDNNAAIASTTITKYIVNGIESEVNSSAVLNPVSLKLHEDWLTLED